VLGTLVRLSEADRPSGIQAEVLRAVQNMVVLMDEQFLVHSVVHKAVLRLLRNCVGDELQEQLDGRRVLGAAGGATRRSSSEYEEDCAFQYHPMVASLLNISVLPSGESTLHFVQSHSNPSRIVDDILS